MACKFPVAVKAELMLTAIQCLLYFFYLLGDCINVLLPYLTAMVNASLREGSLPESQKRAVLTPLLKKPSLDAQDSFWVYVNIPYRIVFSIYHF